LRRHQQPPLQSIYQVSAIRFSQVRAKDEWWSAMNLRESIVPVRPTRYVPGNYPCGILHQPQLLPTAVRLLCELLDNRIACVIRIQPCMLHMRLFHPPHHGLRQMMACQIRVKDAAQIDWTSHNKARVPRANLLGLQKEKRSGVDQVGMEQCRLSLFPAH
jgi:hypothetical protein